MLSGSSVLQPGLRFALFTPSFNYVTSATMRQQDPPPELKLTKYYFLPHIEALENQLAEVQALGSAAAQEWFKGLQSLGKQRQDDIERLEQWEASFAARIQIKPQAAAATLTTPSLLQASPPVAAGNLQSLSHDPSSEASLRSPRRFSARGSEYSSHMSCESIIQPQSLAIANMLTLNSPFFPSKLRHASSRVGTRTWSGAISVQCF